MAARGGLGVFHSDHPDRAGMRLPQIPAPLTSDRDKGEINVWTGRRIDGGGRHRSEGSAQRGQKTRSGYRCIPALDTGTTRGSKGGVRQFCLYFAR